MKFTINKGSAAVELVLIAPILMLVLMSFFKLFQKAAGQESELIAVQKMDKEKLQHDQQALSILDRPCVVHPNICIGRKK